jgi:peptidoglycan/xylan/chitin deacetylase (PgdA/CDA1 family)
MLKNIFYPGCIFSVWLFMSCASQTAVVPPSEFPPLAPVESAIFMIKQNPPELKKYFILDDNKDIIVKSELMEVSDRRGKAEHFDAIYDMKYFRPEVSEDMGAGFLVPFVVQSLETGQSRRDMLFWKPGKDASGILLAFDDDYQEVWESQFDLFDYYHARATFFVQGSYCSFCTAALERGHDVGYHTLNHLNLPKVSREVFFAETLSEVDGFRNAGIPLLSFAYPFGLFEDWMHEELLSHFKILRGYGVTFRVYNSAQIREGYISSRALDTILFKQDEDFEAEVDVMLRTVKFVGGDLVLPLTTHDISDTANWGIKPHRLRYLLQGACDLQLNFYLYRDFL